MGWTSLGRDGIWETIGKILGIRWAVIEDQKTAGTAGGTFTSSAWRTRVLNTIVYDSGGIVASLASNQIVFGAGTYLLFAIVPAFTTNRHQTRLYNATAASVTQVGTNAFNTGSAATTSSYIVGVFVANGTDAYEVQNQCQNTQADNGFGVSINATFAVTREVYAHVLAIRIA